MKVHTTSRSTASRSPETAVSSGASPVSTSSTGLQPADARQAHADASSTVQRMAAVQQRVDASRAVQRYPEINSNPPDRKDSDIYGIHRQVGGSLGAIAYVGQSLKNRYGKRFEEHVNDDAWAPWHASKWGKQYDGAENTWPYVVRLLEALKNVTRFEVTAAEQWWIENEKKGGAALSNRQNAMTKATFRKYRGITGNYDPTNIQVGPTWEPSA